MSRPLITMFDGRLGSPPISSVDEVRLGRLLSSIPNENAICED